MDSTYTILALLFLKATILYANVVSRGGTPLQNTGFRDRDDFMKKVATSIKTNADFLKYVKGVEVLPAGGDGEDRVVVNGESRPMTVSVFDACNPRGTTYKLPVDPLPNVIVWPPCTRINKCAGCCTTEIMKCVPTKIVTKTVTAVRTVLPSAGDQYFRFLDYVTFLVDSEEECEPRCLRSPSDCNAMQDFYDLDCKCICRNMGTNCDSGKYFNEDTCTCECVNIILDCPGNHSMFNHDDCSCRPMTIQELQLSGGLDNRELLEYLELDKHPSNQTSGAKISEPSIKLQALTTTSAPITNLTTSSTNAPPTTTTTTTTTTTPTTTPPPTIKDCSDYACLPNWRPIPFGDDCMCLPSPPKTTKTTTTTTTTTTTAPPTTTATTITTPTTPPTTTTAGVETQRPCHPCPFDWTYIGDSCTCRPSFPLHRRNGATIHRYKRSVRARRYDNV